MNKKINPTLAIAIIILITGAAGALTWFSNKKQDQKIDLIAMQSAKKNVPTRTTSTILEDNEVSNNSSACSGVNQITDSRDVNNPTYQTIAIGTQCWLNRNLNIGIKINGLKKQTDNTKIEKYCYSNDEANCNTDGGLYLWDEAMQYTKNNGTQGICPTGWHIPSDTDWVALEKYLANDKQNCIESRNDWGCEPAGDKLKPTELCGQNEQAYCGTSGFNAVYAGDRNDYAHELFTYRGDTALFWSSTQYNTSSAWERHLYAKWNNGIDRGVYTKTNAFSIRCVKN